MQTALDSSVGVSDSSPVVQVVRRFLRIFVLWATVAFLVQTFQPDLGAQDAGAGQAGYLRRSQLRSGLRDALTLLGDRLERPGKELVALAGVLQPASAPALAFHAVWELPGNLRIETSKGVLIFDGQTVTGVVTAQDEALLETLFYDTAEHFFLAQAQGLTTRFLGTRFQLDDGGKKDYSGPWYDVYQVTDPVHLGVQARVQSKAYYLNSDTLLLERVRYQSIRDSRVTEVEVQLENWQRADGQASPGRIVRSENGQVQFTLTINSAVMGPREH